MNITIYQDGLSYGVWRSPDKHRHIEVTKEFFKKFKKIETEYLEMQEELYELYKKQNQRRK